MSQFEFFLAITSVVLAFGLGELARFWGDMLQRANRGQVGWLRIAWSAFLMASAILYWTGMWAYEARPFTHFRDVYVLVLPSLLFVLACHALTGRVSDDRPGEDTYFWSNVRVIYVSIAVFLLSTTWADYMLLDDAPTDAMGLVVLVLMTGVPVLLSFTTRAWLHGIWVVSVLALTLLFAATAELDRIPGNG